MSLLMIPGPTNVPQRIKDAIARDPVPHREKGFLKLFKETADRLKPVFGCTDGEVILLASTGSGAMEASITSMFDPEDKVLNIVSGKFSERYMEITQAHHRQSVVLNTEWGARVPVEKVKEVLDIQNVAGVTICRNETSTGVCNVNEIKEIGKLVRAKGGYLIVDAISSLGGMEMNMDQWNVDVCVSAGQKCFMLPPIIAFMCMNKRAIERMRTRKNRGYYLDPIAYLDDKDKAPYTPPINAVFGLAESLNIMYEEGLQKRYARHHEMALHCRALTKKLGLRFYPKEEAIMSDVVTAMAVEGFDESAVRKRLAEEYKVNIAGGQGQVKGKIIRVAHMGMVTKENLDYTMQGLGKILAEVRGK